MPRYFLPRDTAPDATNNILIFFFFKKSISFMRLTSFVLLNLLFSTTNEEPILITSVLESNREGEIPVSYTHLRAHETR